MKNVRRSLAAALLLLVLTTAAFAGQGEMGTPIPPPAGQIDTPPADTSLDTVTVDALADFALDVWQFMPSLY
jgi:hypothetical protein